MARHALPTALLLVSVASAFGAIWIAFTDGRENEFGFCVAIAVFFGVTAAIIIDFRARH